MSAPRIPLYRVESSLDDANSEEATSFASASSYLAALDAHGIPARIVFERSVTAEAYCNDRCRQSLVPATERQA